MSGPEFLLKPEADPGGPTLPAGADRPGRRRRWGRWGLLMVVLLVLVLVAAYGLVLHQRDSTGKAALTGVVPARPAGTVATGVYAGSERFRVNAFRQWYGGKVDMVVMFTDRTNWAAIADPAYMLSEWKDSDLQLVDSLAMLPDGDPSATFEIGATGAYNQYFQARARNLVKAGLGDAVIRLGWEFNIAISRWSTGDSKAFIAYWRQIVTTMRAVPGQHFQFDWNPNNGGAKYDAVNYYPGNAYVDHIGVDAYDIAGGWRSPYPYPKHCDATCRAAHQKAAWDESIYGGSRGLKFWSDFARHRGKPMSIPEWAMWTRPDGHGGGDDPDYLRRMHAFIVDPRNDVAYQSYFEFDGSDGEHRLMTTFADSGDVFRSLFAHP